MANSRYATILEEKGVCYLALKTVERAHTPKDLWEKIQLDKSYNKALQQIDEHLQYWPEFLKHKCKQRFTRFRQVLVKKRKMRFQDTEQYEVVSRKAEKREKSRSVKAEKAALVENRIEQALLQNLKEGKYDQIYNVDQKLFNQVLDEHETFQQERNEIYEEDFDDIENLYVKDLKYTGSSTNDDFEENETRGNFDKENFLNKKRKASKRKKIEYEREDENNYDLELMKN